MNMNGCYVHVMLLGIVATINNLCTCICTESTDYMNSLHLLIDVQSPSWAGHRKHIFIFSLSGKPVYSRYGKEDKLVTMYGIMQALVSLVQDDKDTLRLE